MTDNRLFLAIAENGVEYIKVNLVQRRRCEASHCVRNRFLAVQIYTDETSPIVPKLITRHADLRRRQSVQRADVYFKSQFARTNTVNNVSGTSHGTFPKMFGFISCVCLGKIPQKVFKKKGSKTWESDRPFCLSDSNGPFAPAGLPLAAMCCSF